MNFYSDRKKKRNSLNLRNNIYTQRVDNNVTKQFREIHNPMQNNPLRVLNKLQMKLQTLKDWKELINMVTITYTVTHCI